MNITLHKPNFVCETAAPTSKSAAHRMMIAAAFADAPTAKSENNSSGKILITISQKALDFITLLGYNYIE